VPELLPARVEPEAIVPVLDDGLGEVRGTAALIAFLAAIAGTSLTLMAWLVAPWLWLPGLALDLVTVLACTAFLCERWVEVYPSGPVLATRVGPLVLEQRVRRLSPEAGRVRLELARPRGDDVTILPSEATRAALAHFDYRGRAVWEGDRRVRVRVWRPLRARREPGGS
jgi:hypothetical protein